LVGCGQLEYRAVAVIATVERSAVEVAVIVEDQARKWILPIALSTAKPVKDLLLAFCGQLKDRAAAITAACEVAAICRGPIEVARIVNDQARKGIGPIAQTVVVQVAKAMEDFLRTSRGQLEYRSADIGVRAFVGSASGCGAVEVSRIIEDHARVGIVPIARLAAKTVEDGFGLGLRGKGDNQQQRGKRGQCENTRNHCFKNSHVMLVCVAHKPPALSYPRKTDPYLLPAMEGICAAVKLLRHCPPVAPGSQA